MEEENNNNLEEEISSEDQKEADEYLESSEGQELVKELEEEEIKEEQEKILAQAEEEKKSKLEQIKRISEEKGIPLTEGYKIFLETKVSQEEKEKLQPKMEEISKLINQLKEEKTPIRENELKQKLVEKWLDL